MLLRGRKLVRRVHDNRVAELEGEEDLDRLLDDALPILPSDADPVVDAHPMIVLVESENLFDRELLPPEEITAGRTPESDTFVSE